MFSNNTQTTHSDDKRNATSQQVSNSLSVEFSVSPPSGPQTHQVQWNREYYEKKISETIGQKNFQAAEICLTMGLASGQINTADKIRYTAIIIQSELADLQLQLEQLSQNSLISEADIEFQSAMMTQKIGQLGKRLNALNQTVPQAQSTRVYASEHKKVASAKDSDAERKHSEAAKESKKSSIPQVPTPHGSHLTLDINTAQTVSGGEQKSEDQKRDFEDEIKKLMPLAEEGDVDAQCKLGWYYENGLGTKIDQKLAFYWYDHAAKEYSIEGQTYLGRCYLNGIGVKVNLMEASQLLTVASRRQNNAAAEWARGSCYEHGFGLIADKNIAFISYKKSAEKKFVPAMNTLAIAYESGIGTAKNLTESMKWYRLAAYSGSIAAEFNLERRRSLSFTNTLSSSCLPTLAMLEMIRGVKQHLPALADRGYAPAQLMLYGLFSQSAPPLVGISKDEKEAMKWLRLAVDQEYAPAQYQLACCYESGNGVNHKDKKEAVKWLQLAADQGNAKAQYKLGCYYERENEKEAIRLFQSAALGGLADAQYKMGKYYGEIEDEDDNRGIKKDEKEAAKLFHLAAEQELISAQNQLGVCYEKGQGVIKNLKEAMKWYCLASKNKNRSGNWQTTAEKNSVRVCLLLARQGDLEAQYYLGGCYEYGRGTKSDKKEAEKWYRLAATNGSAAAQNRLGDAYRFGYSIVAQDEKEAVRWYHQAAEQCLVEAQESLASCYDCGSGVEKKEEAVKWLRLAAEQGSTSAQRELAQHYKDGTGTNKDEEKAVILCRQVFEKEGYDYYERFSSDMLNFLYRKDEEIARNLLANFINMTSIVTSINPLESALLKKLTTEEIIKLVTAIGGAQAAIVVAYLGNDFSNETSFAASSMTAQQNLTSSINTSAASSSLPNANSFFATPTLSDSDVVRQKLYQGIFQRHYDELAATGSFSAAANITSAAKALAEEEYQKLTLG